MNEHNGDYHQMLIEAFEDNTFQKEINVYRYEIEAQLKGFLEWLAGELLPNQKFFHSPESRIKSKISFGEKIGRKDYIVKWQPNGKKEDLQMQILQSLPDLIGFRITCYFMDDEEVIYKKIQEYYEQKKFIGIELDFTEGTRQKNGKIIYKVSGKYQEKASFELQIKAAMHNVWGEVEHKTIYKGQQYSINSEAMETVTGEIFNVLRASDYQLLALFKNSYTEEDLVCALFSELTREKIRDAAKTEYLAGHYASFFDIFFHEAKNAIYQYVSSALSNGKWMYEKAELDLGKPDKVQMEIIEDIKACFKEYYLAIQFSIAQELYSLKGYEEFLVFLVKILLRPLSDKDDMYFIEEDVFSDSEEIESPEEDVKALVQNLLRNKLSDAYKEGK